MDVRIGQRFRALRQRLDWRQVDVALKAGVSRGVVSLIERGHLERVSLANLRAVARALDAEFFVQLRWRGGELDRLMDEGHAQLVGRVAAMLRDAGWDVRLEASYSVYGERGSIDILAWHATTSTLLVVEVKTDLVAIEETLRKHDEKVRLAPRVAAEQGWQPKRIARVLVLPELSTPRRRVARHAAVLAPAYPTRGVELRRWLKEPNAALSGLLFIEPGTAASGRRAVARKRVRVGRRAA